MANSVDPVCSGSTLFASILNSSVMLGNYLQQTTSADDIFRSIFFLALKGLTKVGCYILTESTVATESEILVAVSNGSGEL